MPELLLTLRIAARETRVYQNFHVKPQANILSWLVF
jgi:hypothetical protein